MQQVTVYINRNRDKSFEGYQHGDPLVPALVFEVPAAIWKDTILALLESIFVQLNSSSPSSLGTLSLEMIATYHRAYPSISVGDVIEVVGQRWAVASTGFRSLDDIVRVPRVANLARNFYSMIGALSHEAQVRQSVFADAINSMPESEARDLLAALEDLDLRIQQAKVSTLYEDRFKS